MIEAPSRPLTLAGLAEPPAQDSMPSNPRSPSVIFEAAAKAAPPPKSAEEEAQGKPKPPWRRSWGRTSTKPASSRSQAAAQVPFTPTNPFGTSSSPQAAAQVPFTPPKPAGWSAQAAALPLPPPPTLPLPPPPKQQPLPASSSAQAAAAPPPPPPQPAFAKPPQPPPKGSWSKMVSAPKVRANRSRSRPRPTKSPALAQASVPASRRLFPAAAHKWPVRMQDRGPHPSTIGWGRYRNQRWRPTGNRDPNNRDEPGPGRWGNRGGGAYAQWYTGLCRAQRSGRPGAEARYRRTHPKPPRFPSASDAPKASSSTSRPSASDA